MKITKGETCWNCGKEITDMDKATYSSMKNAFLCSLTCFTDWAHEEMGCEPVTTEEEK